MKLIYAISLMTFLALAANAQERLPHLDAVMEEMPGIDSDRAMHDAAPASLRQENPAWIPSAITDETVLQTTAVDDTLYMLLCKENDMYEIVKWDGTGTQRVTLFQSDGVAATLCHYNGELYIGGGFDAIDRVPGTSAIARWNGVSWRSVGGGMAPGLTERDSINVLRTYKGELYCGGGFDSIGGVTARNIARWNGNRWEEVNGGVHRKPTQSHRGVIKDMEIYRDKLYACGYFNYSGALPAHGLASWDGDRWIYVDTTMIYGVYPYVYDVQVYDDRLIVNAAAMRVDTSLWIRGVASWDERSWGLLIKGLTSASAINRFCVYKGDLYASGYVPATGVARWSGSRWEQHWTFDFFPNHMFEFGGTLFYSNPQSNYLHCDARLLELCDTHNCGRIAGTIYYDAGNCSPGTAEAEVGDRIVEITPGPIYVMSDQSGSYSQYLSPGDYRVRILPRRHWATTCPEPAAVHAVTIDSAGDNESGRDFGVRAYPNIRDLRVSIAAGVARPGFPILYSINLENIGTLPMEGTIRLRHDPTLTLQSASPEMSRNSAGIVEWDFTGLMVGESRTITAIMLVPATAPRASMLCADAMLLHTLQEFTDDDRDSICVEVRGSFDPNDITTWLYGRQTTTNYITPRDTVLTYRIRFQNTGNDTAFRVVVIDTLGSPLDPTTIRLGAASHPFEFSMDAWGILRWTFDDIMLPDSGTNEPRSHGFLNYSVHLKRDIPALTSVLNRASIYFDFNTPVQTNLSVNIILAPAASVPISPTSRIAPYPNPTSGSIVVPGERVAKGIIMVRDLLGVILLSTAATEGETATIDLGNLKQGLYFLSIPTREGIITERVMVIR